MPRGDRVESPHNGRLKAARAVRAGRDREHLLLEGRRLAAEALEADAPVEWLLVDGDRVDDPELAALLARAEAAGTEVATIDGRLLAAEGDLDSPSGVLALARRPVGSLEGVLGSLADQPALLLVSAGVQDPGNVGALVRVAAGLGVAGFVALSGSASPWHPRALRGASGTTFRLPIAERVELDAWLAAAREASVSCWAAAADGAPVTSVPASAAGPDTPPRLALVVGEEGRGVPPELARACDGTVGIPLARGVESLNVATAAAILVDRLLEQLGGRA